MKGNRAATTSSQMRKDGAARRRSKQDLPHRPANGMRYDSGNLMRYMYGAKTNEASIDKTRDKGRGDLTSAEHTTQLSSAGAWRPTAGTTAHLPGSHQPRKQAHPRRAQKAGTKGL